MYVTIPMGHGHTLQIWTLGQCRYIMVCCSKQGILVHKTVHQCWSTKNQRVEKVNNLSVQSCKIEVSPKLDAGMESYKAVETILKQLRQFLIHAKRKEDLRMMQKNLSNPHNLIVAWLNDIKQNHLSLHRFSHVKHCTANKVCQREWCWGGDETQGIWRLGLFALIHGLPWWQTGREWGQYHHLVVPLFSNRCWCFVHLFVVVHDSLYIVFRSHSHHPRPCLHVWHGDVLLYTGVCTWKIN